MKTERKARKTTLKDYATFQKWVHHYLALFGLNDWTVYFTHENLPGACAQVNIQLVARGATFTLCTDDLGGGLFKEHALHEVCHLLIADLSHMVANYCTEEEHKRTDEALVCRLTNLLGDKKTA